MPGVEVPRASVSLREDLGPPVPGVVERRPGMFGGVRRGEPMTEYPNDVTDASGFAQAAVLALGAGVADAGVGRCMRCGSDGPVYRAFVDYPGRSILRHVRLPWWGRFCAGCALHVTAVSG